VPRKVNISQDDPFASIFIPNVEQDLLDDDNLSEHSDVPNDGHWKNSQYWSLPENVRNAIDVAQMKKKHSDFYYQLRLLNDKIHVFTSIFYNKVPKYQKAWYIQ
jgi:hypothetical protein